MSTILVTGASGLIGNLLVEELKSRHNVLALSRHKPQGEGFTYIRGDFANWEDLSQLDAHNIDGVVPLAAVTGGLASGAPIRSMNQTGCDNQYAWLYEYWRMADPGLTLIKRAKSAKRSWMPLTFPVIRTMLRTIR